MSDGIYVGLMSGTSLDGISAAVVRIADAGGHLEHELLGFTLTEYTPAQRERLASAMQRGTADEYCRLGFALGDWLATAAVHAMNEAGVRAEDVRAIGSHGQTLWHVPAESTWQVGETAVIAERTGVDVVGDFRVRDVAAGGEGAPLVPIAEALLYADPVEWRLLQNIGGIGNVTVLPPGGDVSQLRAFDTGPGVAIIDAVVRVLYPGVRYDENGAIAREGSVVRPVLDALLADPYFVKEPPKSTGREHFGVPYAESFVHRCTQMGATPQDVVATAVALTAESIGAAYRAFVREPASRVIASGGGTRNGALMDALRAAIAPRELVLFDDVYYDAEAKEAVAFALLAYLHVARSAGNVTGATGARGPRVLGKLTPA
jgi:anhydro-N-acetylmuramic acid kinase